ncbi:uncharacterized protein [Euphorbia lathyris]|uniref:uncharacterized protein isoform X2 n=1 Tax=Euphorbia lathyris TaxID=212925 RepID=UPI0033142740
MTGIPLQEPYIRTREHPYFDGLLRGDNASKDQAYTLEFQGNGVSLNFSRTASDITDARSKSSIESISEKSMDSPAQDSLSDPIGHSAFEKLSQISQVKSFAFSSFKSDVSVALGDSYESTKKPSVTISADVQKYHVLSNLATPVIEKSFSMNQNKQNLLVIPLPQSAASFYNALSPQVEILESCESIKRLNSYLQARKEDVRAGGPGRFLHAIIAQDISDVGSVAATIMYAFYLNETLESDQLCTVPVISMKRVDLGNHAELKWLLDSCQIDESSLIFVDEIDLAYYNLFGSLKLVVLNGHKLPTKLEALKGAVVEIFNCRKDESVSSGVEDFIMGEDSSCCTLIAEKFSQTSPEILAGHGFSRLLLAGILLDTGNLTNPRCTTKDQYMATLLINGAGRFGSNGLHQLLRYKMYDVSDLRVVDILRKDFKKWTRVGKPDSIGSRSLVSYVAMSSIGIPIEQLLVHGDNSAEEIKYFQQLEKLRLLVIVSGYYDSQKNFKREMLVAAESVEHMKSLVLFFNSHASHLPLKVVDRRGLKEEMRMFKIDKVISRKTIELLVEEFDGASRG